MTGQSRKRQADTQIIAQWVNEGSRVLDLGCGRGILLEYLKQKKGAYGVGVDIEFDRILSCIKRGVTAYQGDIHDVLSRFPDGSFDHVLFSRSVELLANPAETFDEALRVGKRVAVGFINYGFWVNRVNKLLSGIRTVNEAYPKPWYESQPSNNFSIAEFESFCQSKKITVHKKVHLGGDWKSGRSVLPNLFAGYALYEISR